MQKSATNLQDGANGILLYANKPQIDRANSRKRSKEDRNELIDSPIKVDEKMFKNHYYTSKKADTVTKDFKTKQAEFSIDNTPLRKITRVVGKK